ncbi:sensor histidine kinase [Nocardiopsis sp. NPDC050513]|uniref:sensor histidine kinase n=1 Tax=Nocardiopsis sp. NPDC050513 TaxID=3364338 RepID=UPI0037B4354C
MAAATRRDVRARTTAAAARVGGHARILAAVLAGLGTAALTMAGAALAAAALPALAWPRTRRRVAPALAAGVRVIADLELRRLSRWAGLGLHASPHTAPRMLYLGVRLVVAAVTAAILFVLGGLWALFAGGTVWEAVTGTASEVWITLPGVSLSTSTIALGTAFALITFLGLWGALAGVTALDRSLARRILGPSTEDLLTRRIDELSRSRSGIVRAVDEERRRIERDLHDGVQQRVVALAMLLGRAQRGDDPERAARLVGQAHEQTRVLLDELREVAWRVYPTALDTLGLESALHEIAERAPLPVAVECDLPDPLPPAAATAVYFAAREAITNAVKHARPHRVRVRVRADRTRVELSVSDDGHGGADPRGQGLTGLLRRVRALDGTLSVHSPDGGPTVVRAHVPLTDRPTAPTNTEPSCAW